MLGNLDNISDEILRFFSKLYNKSNESWRFGGLDWVPISEVNAISLEKPFTRMELREAIFQMDKKKAIGLHGFNIDLYECWDTIKDLKVDGLLHLLMSALVLLGFTLRNTN